MKIRNKIVAGIASAVFMLVIGVGSANADVDCASAVVSQVGVLPSLQATGVSKYIASFDCLDDGATDTSPWAGSQQHVLSSDLGDSGYATLLTAVSLGQTVYIRVQSPTWRSLATLLYLNDTPVP